jgi:hypothetical protein
MFQDFEHIALRAAPDGMVVGQICENSKVWVDGECMEDEDLPGACGIRVSSDDDIQAIIDDFREMYAFDGRKIYVIGGDCAEIGNDDGEIIIRKAQVLAVLS